MGVTTAVSPKWARPLLPLSCRGGGPGVGRATWRRTSSVPVVDVRRLALVGSLCYIRPGDERRGCPFLVRLSEAR